MARAISFAVIFVMVMLYSRETSAGPTTQPDDMQPPMKCQSELEEYVENGPCESKCVYLPGMCGLLGDTGCVCKSGYARAPNGDCVLKRLPATSNGLIAVLIAT